MTHVDKAAVVAATEVFHETAQFIAKQFFNRPDLLAIRNPRSKSPLPVVPSNLLSAIEAHISLHAPAATFIDRKFNRKFTGNFQLGTYSPAVDGTTIFGVIDLDGPGTNHKYPLAQPLETALEIASRASALGLHAHIERSGSGTGFHLWFLFEKPVVAKVARSLLFELSDGKFLLANGNFADPRANKGIEVFPKQDKILSSGFGNFVWLPFHFRLGHGCGQFLKTDGEATDFSKVVGFNLISPRQLEPWSNLPEVFLPVKSKALLKSFEPELRKGFTGLEPLRKIAKKCEATRGLLELCFDPPAGGMGHDERFKLAQIARQAGVDDEVIVCLFRRQPNFNQEITRINVKSVALSLPPPSCRRIAGEMKLCSYPCHAIKSINRGTPIAFAEMANNRKGK